MSRFSKVDIDKIGIGSNLGPDDALNVTVQLLKDGTMDEHFAPLVFLMMELIQDNQALYEEVAGLRRSNDNLANMFADDLK